MASITVANLVPRVRRWLEPNGYEGYITSAVTTTSTTTVAVDDGTQWNPGAVGEFSDGEQFYVRSISTNNLTVKRGHNGTTAATHLINDVVLKNPRFTYDQISEALTRIVDGDLWPWAWKAASATLTPDTTKVWYDLAATAMGLISVVQLDSSSPVSAYDFGARGSGLPVTFKRNRPTSLVASGVGLAFPNGFAHATNTVYVTYQALITTSDIDDGLMSDCVVYGACAHLMEMKDIPRTAKDVSQGDTTVTPGSVVRTAAWFRGRFEEKRRQLQSLCMAQSPPMSRVG